MIAAVLIVTVLALGHFFLSRTASQRGQVSLECRKTAPRSRDIFPRSPIRVNLRDSGRESDIMSQSSL